MSRKAETIFTSRMLNKAAHEKRKAADVYKRQEDRVSETSPGKTGRGWKPFRRDRVSGTSAGKIVRVWKPSRQDRVPGTSPWKIGRGWKPFRRDRAVSYTHLDVYKRQTPSCGSLSGLSPTQRPWSATTRRTSPGSAT